jgi:hypothetical protein
MKIDILFNGSCIQRSSRWIYKAPANADPEYSGTLHDAGFHEMAADFKKEATGVSSKTLVEKQK